MASLRNTYYRTCLSLKKLKIVCPLCNISLKFGDFHRKHVFRVHNLKRTECPFCFGDFEWRVGHKLKNSNLKHVVACIETFRQTNTQRRESVNSNSSEIRTNSPIEENSSMQDIDSEFRIDGLSETVQNLENEHLNSQRELSECQRQLTDLQNELLDIRNKLEQLERESQQRKPQIFMTRCNVTNVNNKV
ncbi:hypothetical protein AVEN_123236-1 [Araneus ventricosus]|uniref:Uncharacterized protein n=1 Tax=Araneus ventricosus TaxID=182803 RepID=A0A4Y2QRA2_ARAVE|nr:hypothetical protein AVEN_17656-1 [Araneus ventricosus]GBN65843.1 hypothetical protein AVEN_123236-1 [Araneus ventricosus]